MKTGQLKTMKIGVIPNTFIIATFGLLKLANAKTLIIQNPPFDKAQGTKSKIQNGIRAFILGLCLTSGSVLAQTLPLPRNLINFNSTEGEELLLASKARKDYWSLSTQFVTQTNQAYCGVASIVMVLNALSIPAPLAPEYSPYHVFTQENFFNNEQTKKVLSPKVVSRQGMTLTQLGQLLGSYPVKVKVYHASETSLEEFRSSVVANLKQPSNFVLVNYLRRRIGQEKGGHISPIAAYNEQTDRFLILDVSRYKYPPVWVKAAELWQAMATMDSVSGKTRGFVMVSQVRPLPGNQKLKVKSQ